MFLLKGVGGSLFSTPLLGAISFTAEAQPGILREVLHPITSISALLAFPASAQLRAQGCRPIVVLRFRLRLWMFANFKIRTGTAYLLLLYLVFYALHSASTIIASMMCCYGTRTRGRSQISNHRSIDLIIPSSHPLLPSFLSKRTIQQSVTTLYRSFARAS